jgi:hypothetical protein
VPIERKRIVLRLRTGNRQEQRERQRGKQKLKRAGFVE